MKRIADLTFKPHRTMAAYLPSAEQVIVDFPNGYRASVLRGEGFYTANGTYEIAVMRGKRIVYDTPVTSDVLGYLSEAEADAVLAEIAALPPTEATAADMDMKGIVAEHLKNIQDMQDMLDQVNAAKAERYIEDQLRNSAPGTTTLQCIPFVFANLSDADVDNEDIIRTLCRLALEGDTQ